MNYISVSNNQTINEITVNSVFKIKGFLMKQGVPIVGTLHLLSIASGKIELATGNKTAEAKAPQAPQ